MLAELRSAPALLVAPATTLPEGFAELAADALADGHRLLEVLNEDWQAGACRFDAPGEVLFVVHAGRVLVGVGGLTRDPYARTEPAARVRRLYVRRVARRHGAGAALLGAIVGQARRAGWDRLRVRAPVAAFPFYERAGFLRAVGEPAATHVSHLIPGAPGTP